jgi:hypothetical protein
MTFVKVLHDDETVMTDTKLRIRRIRTELSFILSDRAHGGPERLKEVNELRIELHKLLELREESEG